MYLLLTWYTLIKFLKVLCHLILKIKSFMKYFIKGVLKYFKIFMNFLNISKWNISSCISTNNQGPDCYRRLMLQMYWKVKPRSTRNHKQASHPYWFAKPARVVEPNLIQLVSLHAFYWIIASETNTENTVGSRNTTWSIYSLVTDVSHDIRQKGLLP